MAAHMAGNPRRMQTCHSLMSVILNGGGNLPEIKGGRLCHSLMSVILNGGGRGWLFVGHTGVPLVDVCDTEWRHASLMPAPTRSAVPLVDVCDTEWRPEPFDFGQRGAVPLVDVCDTEWRPEPFDFGQRGAVPLVDVCDTEWRHLEVTNDFRAISATR